MSTNERTLSAWIGRAEVAPRHSHTALEEATGAYVRTVAIAADQGQFIEQVRTALAEMDLDLVGADEVVLLDSLKRRQRLPRDLSALLAHAIEAGVAFDTFCTFED